MRGADPIDSQVHEHFLSVNLRFFIDILSSAVATGGACLKCVLIYILDTFRLSFIGFWSKKKRNSEHNLQVQQCLIGILSSPPATVQ